MYTPIEWSSEYGGAITYISKGDDQEVKIYVNLARCLDVISVAYELPYAPGYAV